ncbi:MAG: succinylglutamate desuccinylase/aspartoacylase family protein [Haloarculaceae archaeon]
MRVEQLGAGDPDVAVVAAIHGDEPCGVHAVERLLDSDPAVERPVKLIVANERALGDGVRYVDTDLNRAFPGDPDADEYERRLAYDLADELRGCTVLALHSTQSHPDPFAIVDGMDNPVRDLCPPLSVMAVVDTGQFVEGRLLVSPETIEVECGLQGSDAAAENATRLVREFLTATGVLAGDTVDHPVPAFRLTRVIPKPPADDYEVFAENFERVEEGETYAAVDGDALTADEPFYPVLLSPYGYRDIFGYRSDRVGVLGAEAPELDAE